VDRAGAAQLIARPTDRHKASQFENLGNSDLRANSGEIDSRHCEQFEKQRRGTLRHESLGKGEVNVMEY